MVEPSAPEKRRVKPTVFLWLFILLVAIGGGLYFYVLPSAPKALSLQSLSSSPAATQGKPEMTQVISDSLQPATHEYAALQKAFWISEGDENAPQKMYVLLDPNCIFCHQLFKELQPLIADKKVAVRWIVVGVIRPSSPDRAQAILTAKDPLAALKFNEANFHDETEEGGIPAALQVSKAAMDRYEQNMRFAIQIQLNMTPVVFFFDTTGAFVRHNGAAVDGQFTALLKHVGGQF